MKLFSFRILAISTFSFEIGMSTRRCFAPQALRMRVSISAIGSVMLIKSISSFYRIPTQSPQFAVRSSRRTRRNEWLPARLANARDVARECEVSETDSADTELSQKSARPAASSATIVLSDAEFRLPLRLFYHGLSCHLHLSQKKISSQLGLSSQL